MRGVLRGLPQQGVICPYLAEHYPTLGTFPLPILRGNDYEYLGDDVIDWGSMLSEGRSMLMTHPSLLFLPILFIFLCTLAFNLLAKQLEGGDAA